MRNKPPVSQSKAQQGADCKQSPNDGKHHRWLAEAISRKIYPDPGTGSENTRKQARSWPVFRARARVPPPMCWDRDEGQEQL